MILSQNRLYPQLSFEDINRQDDYQEHSYEKVYHLTRKADELESYRKHRK